MHRLASRVHCARARALQDRQSVTNRSLLLVSCAALGAIGCAVLFSGGVLVRSFDSIELTQTAAKAEHVLRAFEADLNQLAISNRDYAEWDDAAQFVAERNPSFIESNLTFETLEGMHVDLEWIVDANGDELQSGFIDAGVAKMLQPAPREVFALLRPHLGSRLNQVDSLRARSSRERILGTPRGLLAFSVVEIRRTDKGAPTGAVLIFARYLNEGVLQRVRSTSGLPTSLAAVPVGKTIDSLLPNKSQSVTLSTMPGDAIYVSPINSERIDGYATVRDLSGKPVGLFAISAERTIGVLGRRTTWSLMSALIGLVAIASIGIVLLLARLQRSWLENEAVKRRHDNIIAQVGEGIVLAEPRQGEIIEANAAMSRLLGYTEGDIKYAKLRDIFIDLPALEVLAATQDKGMLRECRLRAADGRLIDAELTVNIVVDNGTRLLCIVTRDLRLRRQLEQQEHDNNRKLAQLTQTDSLTGLPNRIYLQSRLPQLLQGTAGTDRLVSLLYIDIDQFKNINESRGHVIGDELIRVVGKRLRASVASDDILIRMGGDEFVIVTPMMPDLSAVSAVAKRLIECVQAPIDLQGSSVTVTASIGIGVYPSDSIDTESLLKHADIALYQAKEKGRNQFCFFSADMNVQVSEHVALEQELRRAIGTDQLFVEYQPVVDVYTGMLMSFEALVRWNHPEQGLIPPIRFIPVAEKSGLINQLGEDVLLKVIKQQRAWVQDNVPLAPVAINVSPIQLERTDFAILVHELCLDHGLDPKWLHFEVTESSWMQESNKHIVALDTLRSQGSKISIDDFGTGFSNLSYLKQLPVDTLKIDRAFVRNIDSDTSDAAIVKSIIAIAKNLHLDVVAEGVETAAHLAKLREFGCHKAQGYYFSKSIPGHMCRALLEQLGETRRLTESVKARAFKVR
jgi:diguanylate cyclase (GGDEF)-like protein/PAS domain S-box-containing protein